jgi:hypothetical protein
VAASALAASSGSTQAKVRGGFMASLFKWWDLFQHISLHFSTLRKSFLFHGSLPPVHFIESFLFGCSTCSFFLYLFSFYLAYLAILFFDCTWYSLCCARFPAKRYFCLISLHKTRISLYSICTMHRCNSLVVINRQTGCQ